MTYLPVCFFSSVVIHCTVRCLFSGEMFGSMHSLPRLLMFGRRKAFGFCTW